MRVGFWIRTDLKRVFRGWKPVVAAMLTPLFGLLLFAAILAPLLLDAGRDLRLPYAVVNEDESEPVRQFIRLMVHSESLQEVARAYPIKDVKTGHELLQAGKVTVLVHVPDDFYETMEAGRNPEVTLAAYDSHSFERSMIWITLDGSLRAIGQCQNLLQNMQSVMTEAGAAEAESARWMDETLQYGVRQYMSRREVFGKTGTLSPLGDYFPLEYYLAALFSFFAAFTMLPLICKTAEDMRSPVIRRGLLAERRNVLCYLLARLCSGALLIGLTLLIMLPTAGLIQNIHLFREASSLDMRVWFALPASILLISFAYSAFALLLGSLIARPEIAVWCGFFLILLMSLCAGVFVPDGALPEAMTAVGRYMLLKPAMNLLGNILFRFHGGKYLFDSFRLSLIMIVSVCVAVPVICRRGGGI